MIIHHRVQLQIIHQPLIVKQTKASGEEQCAKMAQPAPQLALELAQVMVEWTIGCANKISLNFI
jgi:hypothetical protein